MREDESHYADTQPTKRRYQVFYANELIFECDRAVRLEEFYRGKSYPPVIYFPESVLTALETSDSDKSSFCPIKGEAAYRNFRDAENGIWSYPDPLHGVAMIRNHVAFDLSRGFVVKPVD